MTLILVAASENDVYMCGDFQLSTRAGSSDREMHKISVLARAQDNALLGVTGVAYLDGMYMDEWLSSRLPGTNFSRELADDIEMLRREATRALSALSASEKRLTFVIASIHGTQASITLVSNFHSFENGRIREAVTARPTLSVSQIKTKSSTILALGSGAGVASVLIRGMAVGSAARLQGGDMQRALLEINKAVAVTVPSVSPEARVGHLDALGRGTFAASRAGFGPDFRPPDLIDVDPSILGPGVLRPDSTFFVSVSTEREYKAQLKIKPEDGELWNNYGCLLDTQGRLGEARVAFEKACDLARDNALYRANLAQVAARICEDRQVAQSLFDSAFDLAGDTPPPTLLAGYGSFLAGGALESSVEAEGYFRRAHSSGGFPPALARLGTLRAASGDRSDARSIFDEALEKFPEDPETLRRAALFFLMDCDDPVFAVELAARAYALAPRRRDLTFSAALLSLGRFSDALSLAKRSWRKFREEAGFGEHAGIALLGVGSMRKGLRQLEIVARVSLAPGVHINLAWAHLIVGDSRTCARVLETTSSFSLRDDEQNEVALLRAILEPRLDQLDLSRQFADFIAGLRHMDLVMPRLAYRMGQHVGAREAIGDLLRQSAAVEFPGCDHRSDVNLG